MLEINRRADTQWRFMLRHTNGPAIRWVVAMAVVGLMMGRSIAQDPCAPRLDVRIHLDDAVALHGNVLGTNVLSLYVPCAFLMIASPANPERPQDEASSETGTAKLELRLGQGKTKAVTLIMGQSVREVLRLCRPAKVYADDDPWLIYPAAGDGYYAIFFSAQGTAKEMLGRPDPKKDKLYAVIHYPTDKRENGNVLFPKSMQKRKCGDFVTLKVPLDSAKARVATVSLGMTVDDVMKIFRPAPNRVKTDQLVLFNALHKNGRYLLLFFAQNRADTGSPTVSALSEVLYWPGGREESMYLLPRQKRGKPIPPKYRALLQDDNSDPGSDN